MNNTNTNNNLTAATVDAIIQENYANYIFNLNLAPYTFNVSISFSLPTADLILGFSGNICVILTDILVFGICMWKVWGTWKLKREAGIRSTHSLVSVLIAQSILRCCFVVVITIITEVLVELENSFSQVFTLYQNALSSVLVADFTLDLRSLNSAKIGANNASLPPLQFSNVLQRVHQSLIVELATPENINAEGNDDCDNLGSEPIEGSDIQPAQD